MSYTLESTVLHVIRKRLMSDLPQQIRVCLDSLSDEQTWWRPNEKANSIGNLVLHVCGSNAYYLMYAIAGNDLERDRAAEFSERRHFARAELLEKLNEVVASCDHVLSGLGQTKGQAEPLVAGSSHDCNRHSHRSFTRRACVSLTFAQHDT